MARKKRYMPVDVPLHVVQRGVNGEQTFQDGQDYKMFLMWLKEYSTKWKVAIHAWVLMGNHIHLLITPKDHGSVSRMMANLCGRYANYYNRRYERTGVLWQGRYFSSLIASRYYLIICCRYIELNPVRAGLVDNVHDYEWSSFKCNGMGYESDMHEPHDVYLKLGQNKAERLIQYRKLFTLGLTDKDIGFIRTQTDTGGIMVKNGNEKLVQKRLEALAEGVQLS